MNGIEASRRIRESLENVEVPKIVMVTARGREDIMKQAERIGLQGFLSMPVSPSMLFDMIMELFVKSSGVERRRGAAEDRKPEGFEKILGARILLAEDNEIIAMTADAMTIREANGKTSIIMENYYRTFPKDYDKTINLYIKLN